MNKISILIIGVIIGTASSWGYFVYLPTKIGGVHQVKSIQSHYPKENSNSETIIVVFIKGNSGHVKEVLCQFAPDVVVSKESLKKVRVKGVSQQYAFGQVGHFCDPI